ncbi:MAG: Crp/Fnr family transcriptional regulator [Sphingobacteriaceae bacterium]|nr:Crp/Fnr family transcriptional regulator [Sphingobacteriaceae bacterium]
MSVSVSNLKLFSDPDLISEIELHGNIKSIKKDEILILPGDQILFIPIVLKGSIRIIRQDENDQEVFLYHLFPGQTCAMSLTCCESGKKSMIKAIAETDSEILRIPIEKTETWTKFHEWKMFTSSNYQHRFSELLQVIDLIAFSHMDEQLFHYLKQRTQAINTDLIEITHQQIADELHAHREAISRLLKTMEQKGIVQLGRNNIRLLKDSY